MATSYPSYSFSGLIFHLPSQRRYITSATPGFLQSQRVRHSTQGFSDSTLGHLQATSAVFKCGGGVARRRRQLHRTTTSIDRRASPGGSGSRLVPLGENRAHFLLSAELTDYSRRFPLENCVEYSVIRCSSNSSIDVRCGIDFQ